MLLPAVGLTGAARTGGRLARALAHDRIVSLVDLLHACFCQVGERIIDIVVRMILARQAHDRRVLHRHHSSAALHPVPYQGSMLCPMPPFGWYVPSSTCLVTSRHTEKNDIADDLRITLRIQKIEGRAYVGERPLQCALQRLFYVCDVGRFQRVALHERIIRARFHVLRDVLRRIEQVKPPSGMVEHLPENALPCVARMAAPTAAVIRAEASAARSIGSAVFAFRVTCSSSSAAADVAVGLGQTCPRPFDSRAVPRRHSTACEQALCALFIRQDCRGIYDSSAARSHPPRARARHRARRRPVSCTGCASQRRRCRSVPSASRSAADDKERKKVMS